MCNEWKEFEEKLREDEEKRKAEYEQRIAYIAEKLSQVVVRKSLVSAVRKFGYYRKAGYYPTGQA